MTSLNLIVLYCKDLEKSINFYAMLGLTFIKEQHGNGIVHYSCDVNGIILELYPKFPKENYSKLRLGFTIKNSDLTHPELINHKKESSQNNKVCLTDPDGHKIDVSFE